MSTNRTVFVDDFSFVGAVELVASGSVSPIPWRKTLVAGGTAAGAADGIRLTLTNTAEAQSARLSFADTLSYDIDDLLYAEFLFRITSATLTNVSAIIGMASAGNATINSIDYQASFGINGSMALFCESDDGVRDVDDVLTGITLTTGVWCRARIDFSTGVQTVAAPGTSKGGKANVLFSACSGNGPMRRVCQNQLFDMSAYSAGLQPYIQFQKASSTDLGTLDVRRITVARKEF